MQSLCALSHLDFKQIGVHDYAQLFQQIDQLGLGADARAEAFRRMVFNVAAANCDDHSKNFSFVLPEGGEWRLSPAYDVTHAHAPGSDWTHEHLMAVNGKRAAIGRDDVDTVADRFGVPSAARIVEQVLVAVDEWPRHANEAGVPDAVARENRRRAHRPLVEAAALTRIALYHEGGPSVRTNQPRARNHGYFSAASTKRLRAANSC